MGTMEAGTLAMVLMMVTLLPVMGALLAATPWLMRAGECFAVTVPETAQSDGEIRALKRSYTLAMGVATAALTGVDVALAIAGQTAGTVAVMVAGCLALPALSFALMLRNRGKVRAIKARRGWKAEGDRRSAVVGEGDIPRPVGLRWELLHVPVIVLTVAMGAVGYAGMPDAVPMQVGFDGTVTSWGEKSPALVLLTPGIQAFLAVCMAVSHWSILRSKKPNKPGAPVTSAWAYGMFARAQSVYLVVLGVALDVALVCMQLSMVGALDIVLAALPVTVVAVLAVVGGVALAVVYGQSGARLMGHIDGGRAMDQDDDRYWKLGVLYVNRDDPSLFVPARFGVGWTCNFARPAVWAIGAGITALTVGLVAFALLVG